MKVPFFGFLLAFSSIMFFVMGQQKEKSVRLVVLAPGHFHAALLQNTRYDNVSPVVNVYAPQGPDVEAYLDKIAKYNTRTEAPTQWQEKVYTGTDFFHKMLTEKAGNLVVLAGNNQQKTDYIEKSVAAGFNVLADKPMAIDAGGFLLLKQAFVQAQKNNVLLYDIMTERYEITNALQRELAMLPALFGGLQKGTPQDPAVTKESVHHFFKYVSGEPLIRPSWFFDVNQQGEGIVDVTTHLVDLIQWSCFPEQKIDYRKDIKLISAVHHATTLTPGQFKLVTKSETFPDYLQKNIREKNLEVYANGQIDYTLKGIHARASVVWNFQAPQGTGDTHYSIMKGSKANLIIRQGKEQNYKPVLYIEANNATSTYEKAVEKAFEKLKAKYEGITLLKNEKGWEVVVPKKYDIGHEAHFAQVARKYMEFLQIGQLPAWEVPNMIAKYYTTTEALKMAKTK